MTNIISNINVSECLESGIPHYAAYLSETMWTSFQGQVCKARLSSNFVVWNRSPAEDAQIIQVFQHVPTLHTSVA